MLIGAKAQRHNGVTAIYKKFLDYIQAFLP